MKRASANEVNAVSHLTYFLCHNGLNFVSISYQDTREDGKCWHLAENIEFPSNIWDLLLKDEEMDTVQQLAVLRTCLHFFPFGFSPLTHKPS